MAFRPPGLDQARTFFGIDMQPLVGGYVEFYEAGTTTPKDVYGEQALTTNNGSTVNLNASGRLQVDVWASGDLRYRVYNENGEEQADVDDVIDPSAAGLSLPSGDAGQFLTTDGAGNYSFADVREVPDPTGSANKFLKTDGTSLSWSAGPSDANAVSGTNIITINGDRAIQWGTDSAAASGTFSTSEAVVFGTAFAATPVVSVIPTSNSQSSGPVVVEITALSTTGFTARFDVAEGDQANTSMVNPVPFCWMAVGNV